MTRKSLMQKVARATAIEIVEIFAGCLREEELHDAYTEVVMRVKSSLQRFRIAEKRRELRQRPGTKQPGNGITGKKDN